MYSIQIGMKLLVYTIFITKYRLLCCSTSLCLFAYCVTLSCKRPDLVLIAQTHNTICSSEQNGTPITKKLHGARLVKSIHFHSFIEQQIKTVTSRPHIQTPAVCLCVADIRYRRNSINFTSGNVVTLCTLRIHGVMPCNYTAEQRGCKIGVAVHSIFLV